MKRIYDFQCPNGRTFEKYIDSEISEVDCDICKQKSTRLISCRGLVLDPISGDYPTATMKWAKMRQERIKAERKVASA
jgi:hypothetical protein